MTCGKLSMTLRVLAVLVGLWAAACLYGGVLLISADGSSIILPRAFGWAALAVAVWRASR